jgi:hypothetical protein
MRPIDPRIAMYVIQALHSDGWREQGRFAVEYWAYLEAQTRCCSDGRHYRIVDEESMQVVTKVESSSCRALYLQP